MNSSSATPITLTADSCMGNESRCHIATPAPSTPYPYSPMSPYGAINPYSLMSRYSSAGAAHLQSPFGSPLASSLATGLAYPTDMFHYNPYSALTPTSPLTPSSFWSLTAQQSFHQLNGITFGPSGPISYNTNAHLFNLFSPNSLSPMSPNPDLHSSPLYPRVSSLPSPYASSPGLSSAFMSPSSMPLLLSPSMSSNVDRPPTYLSDNTSTPSSTASMTPSIKCEPMDGNCASHVTSHSKKSNYINNSFDKNNSNERIADKVDTNNDRVLERHSKTSKHSSKVDSIGKSMTTTITTSSPHKEKYSARVEPLMRLEEAVDKITRNGGEVSDSSCKISTATVNTTPNGKKTPDKEHSIKNNSNLNVINAKVKHELIESDMSLPLNSIESKSVPNCDDMTRNSKSKNIIANNSNTQQLSPKSNPNSFGVRSSSNSSCDDNSESDNKNLIIDCNVGCDGSVGLNKGSKDAKRESQLKQLQSYRKESHRGNGSKLAVSAIDGVNGLQTNTTAISVVLPKPKDQVNGEHQKPCNDKLVDKSSHSSNQSLTSSPNSTSATVKSTLNAIQTVGAIQNECHPRTQTVIPCPTKPMEKMTDNLNDLKAIQIQSQSKQSINNKKSEIHCPNDSRNHLTTNTTKLTQNSANSATKTLPKKPRISRKPSSASIPVGIAIAQQRTSPKTKSPMDSNGTQPLKPILPTLSLPVMTNSPILITDSPPAGTSLWIKPTPNSALNNNNSMQTNSQFSLSGDYQLARDSLTGHLYLIRNSSSLPTTPTATSKTPTLIPPLTIKTTEHQSKSSSSTILTLPVGATQTQQFFASLGQTQASTLILDTTNTSPLVQIAATAPVSTVMSNNNSIQTTALSNSKDMKMSGNCETKNKTLINVNINDISSNNSVNVERGCQASISDEELSCDNMKTTATQVDMDVIHSSEEDEESDGKRHKLRLFSERQQKLVDKRSIDDSEDDESSRDSIQLQIVDEMASEEQVPQLPVKSAPVMQFIDHHGLDLLVDSIEEFAAREESNTSSVEQPINGLQLLSTLAEQRSLEERDASASRRHSADSSITSNGVNNNQMKSEFNSLKKRQRSESCFTTNPNRFDENQELLSDLKKSFKTSSCQTEMFDKRGKDMNSFVNLRRSERIFINDSFVSNVCKDKEVFVLDVNKEKELLINREFKGKGYSENKFFKSNKSFINNNDNCFNDFTERVVPISDEIIKSNVKTKDHYVFSGTKSDELVSNENKFSLIKTKIDEKSIVCDINGSNYHTISSDCTKDKIISLQKDNKKKKNKLSTLSSVSSLPTSTCAIDAITGDKKAKKRKKNVTEELETKKKLKTDFNSKQIDESIDSIIKKVSQIDDSIDKPLNDSNSDEKSAVEEQEIISDQLVDELSSDSKDESKNRKVLTKTSFDLYNEKRMKLLDETIDEIIAKQLVPEEFDESIDDLSNELICPEVDVRPKTPELNTSLTQSESIPVPNTSVPTTPLKTLEESPIVEIVKPKPLVKQSSNCSLSSSTSSISSVSDSCQSSTTPALNLKLTETDLDLKLNVIMLVDGLLFVGQICPIQAPDIYGIVLHGERQHRPIIYSQEEMLREAIREIKPSLEELEEGQRVCAYWSTQYRHLYPGYVRSSSPHPNLVFVEFDDGDNGRIAIDDIRLLPQDYPQMKINADPLKNLERRRRMSSCGNKDNKETKNLKQNSDNCCDNKVEDKRTEELPKNSMVSKTSHELKKDFKDFNEMNKKDYNLKNSSKSIGNEDKGSHESICDNMSSKPELKKKKKKHNKEDRHHRHHHNHKHHHCRHHRKCKKHKKSREGSSIASTGSNKSLQTIGKPITEKTDLKTERTIENNTKSTKTNVLRVSVKDTNDCQQLKDTSNGRTVLENSFTDNDNKCNENLDQTKSQSKPVVKKTAKQRALDRLQTNLSEKFYTITSPVRKRHSNDTNTNNNTSAPTPRKRERMPSAEKSKIAAFLPDRQLWHWSGKYIKKTGAKGSRNRKVYYKEIERGREHIRVDDCAVFLSTGRPHLPYIGRIDSMWQTGSGTMIVKVRWFYHPEETKGEPVSLQDKRGALFESSHFDVNDVQTISHKCQVISWTDYQQKKAENPLLLSEDPPNVYYLAGQYEALRGHIDMDPTVPLKSKPKEEKTETIVETNT